MVFPNVSNNEIRFDLPKNLESKNILLVVLYMDREEVNKMNINCNLLPQHLDISGLNFGQYIIKIIDTSQLY